MTKTETGLYAFAAGIAIGTLLGWKFRGWALKKVSGV
jgi:hypothetical protein